RDDVAGERRAVVNSRRAARSRRVHCHVKRIVKHYGRSRAVLQIRKVTVSPGLDRDRRGPRGTAAHALALFAQEEESPVLSVVHSGNINGAADGAAELVALERGQLGAVAVVGSSIGIERAVAQVAVGRSVYRVRAALGGDVNRAAAGAAVLRGQGVG